MDKNIKFINNFDASSEDVTIPIHKTFESVGHTSQGAFADGNKDPYTVYVTTAQAQGPDYCRTPQDVKFWLQQQIVNGDVGSGAYRACKLLEKAVGLPWTMKMVEDRFAELQVRYTRLKADRDVCSDPTLVVYVEDVISQLWLIEGKCKTAGLVRNTSFL